MAATPPRRPRRAGQARHADDALWRRGGTAAPGRRAAPHLPPLLEIPAAAAPAIAKQGAAVRSHQAAQPYRGCRVPLRPRRIRHTDLAHGRRPQPARHRLDTLDPLATAPDSTDTRAHSSGRRHGTRLLPAHDAVRRDGAPLRQGGTARHGRARLCSQVARLPGGEALQGRHLPPAQARQPHPRP